jgi:hypothetical protein
MSPQKLPSSVAVAPSKRWPGSGPPKRSEAAKIITIATAKIRSSLNVPGTFYGHEVETQALSLGTQF